MKNKLIIFLLSFALIFSTTGVIFAEEGLDNPPEKPQAEDYNDNDKIEEYNKQVDEYNEKVTEHNDKVDKDYEDDCAQYEEEKAAVEKNNTFVENVENKVEADTSEARGFENNTTAADEMPTDWSDNSTETPKTIQVEKSETPTGETIKVINLHVYLKENVTYDDLEPTFYNSVENSSFDLSDNIKNNAILTEWEVAEVDCDDTVTLISEAITFAGNIVWLNGKRSWFGADPSPYFMRSIEGYTQGYWTPGGDMLATTATEQDYGWSAGTAYIVHHSEKTVTSNYLENGQLKTEEITVRTTDRQAPKNIFTLFTYVFTRLSAEPEKQELPEEPTKGEYLSYLDKMDLFEEPIDDIIETVIDPTPEKPFIDDESEDEEPVTKPNVKSKNNTTIVFTDQSLSDNSTEEVSEPKTETTISEDKSPTAAPERYWALLNLILSILTVIFGIVFVFHKKDDELEDENKKKVNREKLIAALISLISVIVFILTEDMTATMIWIDKWTILMVVILLGEGVTDYYIHKNSKAEDEELEK